MNCFVLLPVRDIELGNRTSCSAIEREDLIVTKVNDQGIAMIKLDTSLGYKSWMLFFPLRAQPLRTFSYSDLPMGSMATSQ